MNRIPRLVKAGAFVLQIVVVEAYISGGLILQPVFATLPFWAIICICAVVGIIFSICLSTVTWILTH